MDTRTLTMPLALVAALATAAAVQADDPPLTPAKGGGCSIEARALAVGDVIVSTTSQLLSEAIRRATKGDVSHAILVVGSDSTGVMVVEAVGPGVRHVPLDTSLADASLAVAFRHPRVTKDLGARLAKFASDQVDKKYDAWGIVNELRCLVGDEPACPVPNFDRRSFYCSSLVVEAYNSVKIPLLDGGVSWSPQQLARLSFTDDLRYVGHLRTPPPK